MQAKWDKARIDASRANVSAAEAQRAQTRVELGYDLALAYAAVLGTPKIHAMAGLMPKGADRAACRRAVAERFSVERMADRYIQLYRRILDNEAPRGRRN